MLVEICTVVKLLVVAQCKIKMQKFLWLAFTWPILLKLIISRMACGLEDCSGFHWCLGLDSTSSFISVVELNSSCPDKE